MKDINHASASKSSPSDNFTVRQQPKINKIEEKKKEKQKTSVCLAIIKWASTIFMFIFFIMCLVSSKLSVISLGQRITPNVTGVCDEKHLKNCERETAFVMLIFAMCAPHFISLLRALKNAACSTSEPWPTPSAYVWV